MSLDENCSASKHNQAREVLPGPEACIDSYVLLGSLEKGLGFFFSLDNYLIFFFICCCYYLLCVEYNVVSWQPTKHLQAYCQIVQLQWAFGHAASLGNTFLPLAVL